MGDNIGCTKDIGTQLLQFQNWDRPSSMALWHLFDGLWTGTPPRETAGLATTGAICVGRCNINGINRKSCNAGVSYYTSEKGEDITFLTFAHEVGHNLGASHSFEEGQGSTGGIMDYDTGNGILIDGVLKFNENYNRKTEICTHLAEAKSQRCLG